MEPEQFFMPGDGYVVTGWPMPNSRGPECLANPVSKDESASDTYLRSHTQGLEDCLTRLEEALSRMETAQQRTLQVLESLVDSLAEDDEDQPARYLDGRLV